MYDPYCIQNPQYYLIHSQNYFVHGHLVCQLAQYVLPSIVHWDAQSHGIVAWHHVRSYLAWQSAITCAINSINDQKTSGETLNYAILIAVHSFQIFVDPGYWMQIGLFTYKCSICLISGKHAFRIFLKPVLSNFGLMTQYIHYLAGTM